MKRFNVSTRHFNRIVAKRMCNESSANASSTIDAENINNESVSNSFYITHINNESGINASSSSSDNANINNYNRDDDDDTDFNEILENCESSSDEDETEDFQADLENWIISNNITRIAIDALLVI